MEKKGPLLCTNWCPLESKAFNVIKNIKLQARINCIRLPWQIILVKNVNIFYIKKILVLIKSFQLCSGTADPFKANDTLLPPYWLINLIELTPNCHPGFWPSFYLWIATSITSTITCNHGSITSRLQFKLLTSNSSKRRGRLKAPASATVIKQNERELSTE